MFRGGVSDVSPVLRTSRNGLGAVVRCWKQRDDFVPGQPRSSKTSLIFAQITRGVARYRPHTCGFDETWGTFTVFAKLAGVRRPLNVILIMLGLLGLLAGLAVGCGGKPSTRPAARPDTCKESDGPSTDTVRQAIASVPVVVAGSTWIEIARGHTKKCRLYWVQIIPSIADESTAQQLLFFDHNTPLGSPTPNPKPYIAVLQPSDDTVTVQYRWQVGSDRQCCPSGNGTVRFQIGPDGKLKALDKIPHQ